MLCNGGKLNPKTDYTVTYEASPIEAGVYTVTVKGKGNYAGTLTAQYRITEKIPTNTLTITLSYTKMAYDGVEHEPGVTIKNGTKKVDVESNFDIGYDSNIEVGTAYVYITAKDESDYFGTAVKTFKITGRALKDVKVKGFQNELPYDSGNPVEQTVELTDGYVTLIEGVDYTVSYANNTDVGKAALILKGIGGYTGTVKKTYSIKGTVFSTETVQISGFVSSAVYTGDEVKQDVQLTFKPTSEVLAEGVDYTVTYKSNIKTGTATVKFKGAGRYEGTITKTFKITKAKITASDISLKTSYPYVKGGTKAAPTVTVGGRVLVSGKDYTLTYKNHTKLGTAQVTVKGKGNYSGSVTKKYTISAHTSAGLTITAADKAVSAKPGVSTTVVITDTNGKKLKAGTDYNKTVAYTYAEDTYITDSGSGEVVIRHAGDPVGKTDLVAAGARITATVKLKGKYQGQVSRDFRICPKTIANAKVKIPTQYYTGGPVILSYDDITVKVGTTVLTPSDYEIVSFSNNVGTGTAKVTIKGKFYRGTSDFGGIKTVSFKIAKRSLGIAVRFDGNGATSGTMADQMVYRTTRLKDKEYKRTGYKFLGWSTDPGATEPMYKNKAKIYDKDKYKPGAVITLYAVWQPK